MAKVYICPSEPIISRNRHGRLAVIEDPYCEFIASCIEKSSNDTFSISDGYNTFKEWWRDNFYNYRIPNRCYFIYQLSQYLGDPKQGHWIGYKLIN